MIDRHGDHFGTWPTALTITPTDPHNTDAQTRQTLIRMGEIIYKEAQLPIVAQAAEAAGILGGKRIDQAQRAWTFVGQTVKFQDDNAILSRVLGMDDALDLLITPSRLLTMPQPMGDCDDQSMLAGAMLTYAGVPVELVATKSDEQYPDRWSHVFLQAVLDCGQRYVLDCSHGPYPGWEVPRQYDRLVYDLNGGEIHPPLPLAMNRGSESAEQGNPIMAMTRQGLGTVMDDYGNIIPDGFDAAGNTDATAGMPGATGYGGSPGYYGGGGSSGWASVLQSLTKTGGSIAQQALAPLLPGEFIQQNADGSLVRSRLVPGAIPSSTGLTFGTSSLSPMVLVGIVGVVIAIAVMSSKR